MTRHPRSQRYCADVVARRAKNFSFAIRLLPKEKREGLSALYAFARLADDIVDGDRHDLSLEDLQGQLQAVQKAPHVDSDGWQAALGQAIRRFALPADLFADLLAGMATDRNPQPAQTWSDTEHYCYQAASTIGLLCLEVFGYTSPSSRQRARNLGIAMQLTNILRDLREDHARGRQYLPAEDYRDFSLEPQDLFRPHPPAAALAFMRFQVERTQAYYDASRDLDTLIDADARFCPRALIGIYGEYINSMKKDPLASLKSPLKISKGRKFWIAVKSRYLH